MNVTSRHAGAMACLALASALVVASPAHAIDATAAAPTETRSLAAPESAKPQKPRKVRTNLASLAPIAPRDLASYVIDPGVANWYRARGATLPVTDRPVYCHGYGCEFQTPIAMDDTEFAAIKRIFAAHPGGAADERKAISDTVTWWERRASPLLGGPPRQHGSDIAHAHHMGATDCIDEATNSTSILVYLERHGFLKYHRVEAPASRGMIVNAHSTAVILEVGGDRWVVDMWMHNMGEAPDIMTYAMWMSQA